MVIYNVYGTYMYHICIGGLERVKKPLLLKYRKKSIKTSVHIWPILEPSPMIAWSVLMY